MAEAIPELCEHCKHPKHDESCYLDDLRAAGWLSPEEVAALTAEAEQRGRLEEVNNALKETGESILPEEPTDEGVLYITTALNTFGRLVLHLRDRRRALEQEATDA